MKGELIYPCVSPDRLNECGFPNRMFLPFGSDSGVTPPPSIYTPEYQAILDYATLQGYTEPTLEVRAQQNQLIIDLIAAGIWDELDILYVFKGNGNANFAKINWKSPGNFQAIGTGHEPTFISNDGFKGDGIAQYLDTGYDPIVNGVKSTLNVASFFIDVDAVEATDNKFACGYVSGTAPYSASYLCSYQGALVGRVNDAATIYGNAGANGKKFNHIQRTGPAYSEIFYWLDGIKYLPGQTGAVVVPETSNYCILAGGIAGAATGFSTSTARCFGSGSSLIGKEAALYNAWATYNSQTNRARIAYERILNYAISQGYALPSEVNRAQQLSFLTDLVTSGVWDELDVLYVFKTDAEAEFAKINWKSPGNFQAIGTGHEPTFLVNNGFKGDGLTQYLDTQWTPFVHAVKYTQNNSSLIIQVNSNDPDNGFEAGAESAAPSVLTRIGTRNSGSVSGLFSINDFDNTVTPTRATAIGFYHLYRTSPNTTFLSVDGVVTTAGASVSVGLPNSPMYACGRSALGILGEPTARAVSVLGFGSSLSGKDLALYNAWSNYKGNLTLLNYPVDIIVGTDGVAKGYNANGVYGELKSYPIIQSKQLLALYTMPDNSLHVTFVANEKLEGVNRVTLQTPSGEQATLTWDGMEYVGPAPMIAASFIVTTEVVLTLIV